MDITITDNKSLRLKTRVLKFIPLFIFLLTFLARLTFYLVMKQFSGHSWSLEHIGVNGWLEIAQNLATGKGYTIDTLLTYFPVHHLVPTAARGPLPILFLSALLLIVPHHYYHLLFFLSWALSAFCAVLLFHVASRSLNSRFLGFLSAIFYALYLPEMNIATTYAACSESLFTLLLTAYFWVLLRYFENKKTILVFEAGVFLGLAALSRPIAFYLPLVVIPWFFGKGWRKDFGKTAIFLLPFLLCLLPWVMRNQIVFGKPIFTSTLGGYNLLRHNGMIEQNKYYLRESDEFEPIAKNVFADAGYKPDELNEVQADRILMKEAKRIIRRYPFRYLKLCRKRFFWILYKENADQPLYLIPNMVLYPLMFFGIFFAFLQKRRFLIFLSLHILFFIFFHTAINAQFRFFVPVVPCAILLAIFSLAQIKMGLRQCLFLRD